MLRWAFQHPQPISLWWSRSATTLAARSLGTDSMAEGKAHGLIPAIPPRTKKVRRVSLSSLDPLNSKLLREGLGLKCAVPSNSDDRPAMLADNSNFSPLESRRRYSHDLTQGRSSMITDLIEKLRTGEGGLTFDKLHPRVKLDILRRAHIKRRALLMARRTSHLPKYYSSLFNKKYFFKEEDLVECFVRGRGPGGQATNRRSQTAVVQHKPTGIVVRFSKWPSLRHNRAAARDLLHLRIEEKVVGKESTLGQERLRKGKVAVSTRRGVRRLLRTGHQLAARKARVIPFFDILCGAAEFPEAVRAEVLQLCPMAHGGGTSEIKLTCLFNEKCHLWWPLLEAMFKKKPNGITGQRPQKPPLLLSCLFPVVPCAAMMDHFSGNVCASDDERCSYQQLLQCRESPQVMKAIRCALRCYFEMFGLNLTEGDLVVKGTKEVRRTLLLVKDGLNWEQHKKRWATRPQDGNGPESLTPVVALSIPQIFECLVQLGATTEAAAIKRFFLKEARTQPQSWGKEALSLLAAASEGYEPPSPPTADEIAAMEANWKERYDEMNESGSALSNVPEALEIAPAAVSGDAPVALR